MSFKVVTDHVLINTVLLIQFDVLSLCIFHNITLGFLPNPQALALTLPLLLGQPCAGLTALNSTALAAPVLPNARARHQPCRAAPLLSITHKTKGRWHCSWLAKTGRASGSLVHLINACF